MFPTSGERAELLRWARLTSLANGIEEARPELLGCVDRSDGRIVRAPLPPRTHDPSPWVALAPAADGRKAYWRTMGFNEQARLIQTVWEREAPESLLVDAFLATFDACRSDAGLPSPWCWGESAVSRAVELADLLTDTPSHSIEVEWVASGSRLIPHRITGWRNPLRVPEWVGDALGVRMPWGGSLTVSYRDGLGWVADTGDSLGETWRIDLSFAATGTPSPQPGWAADSLDVAGAIRAVAATPPTDSHEGWRWRDASDEDANVSRWLRAIGFLGVVEPERDETGWHGPLDVVVTKRRCGLQALKSAFADAVVAHRPLIVFSPEWFTRDAIAWADRVDVPLIATAAATRDFRPVNPAGRRLSVYIGPEF